MRNELKIRAHLEQEYDTLPLPYVWVELLVDDEPLLEYFQHYAIDLQSLVSSQYSPGDYFIITCTCGLPQCAGITKPIVVTHDGEIIQWVVKSIHPVETYQFDRIQYQTAIERGLKAIRGWFTAYPDALKRKISRIVVGHFRDLDPAPPSPRSKNKLWR
jgi:hypothetical protein